MTVPSWYGLLLLSLAAYRSWRLLAVDEILDPIRNHLRPRKERGWRDWTWKWLSCPWCAGAWLAVGWWAAFEAEPHWTAIIAAPFAISLLVGLISRNLDP